MNSLRERSKQLGIDNLKEPQAETLVELPKGCPSYNEDVS